MNFIFANNGRRLLPILSHCFVPLQEITCLKCLTFRAGEDQDIGFGLTRHKHELFMFPIQACTAL